MKAKINNETVEYNTAKTPILKLIGDKQHDWNKVKNWRLLKR